MDPCEDEKTSVDIETEWLYSSDTRHDPSEDKKTSVDIETEWLYSSDTRRDPNEDLSPSISKDNQPRSPYHKESICESTDELDYEDEKDGGNEQLTMKVKYTSIHQDMHSNSEENLYSNGDEMSVNVGQVSDHDDQHSDSEGKNCNRNGYFSIDKESMPSHSDIHSDSEKILCSTDSEFSLSVGCVSDHQDIHSDSNKNLCSCEETQLSNNIQLTFDNQNDNHLDSERSLSKLDGDLNTKDVQIGIEKKESDEAELEEGEAIDDDGSVDVEEGEIEDISINDNLNKYSCRFFQRGKCVWGKGCRFLHLSDKGLYNMFDSFVEVKKVPPQTSCFTNEANFNCQPYFEPKEKTESIWDRALCEAKERIKQSRVRKEESFDKDEVYKTVENSDRFVEKSKNVDHFHAKAMSPVLTSKKPNYDYSSRIDLYKSDRHIYIKDTVKPKLVKKTYGIRSNYHSEWRDPWRRSKTPPKRKRITSKSSISSKSSRSHDDSSSSSDRASRCRSPITKRARRRSNSASRSYRHLSRRQSCSRSSCSCSSRSSRSSPELSSKRNGKRKRSSPSFSPVYRRKNSHSPEVVLPFVRQSASKLPLKSSLKGNLRNKSVEHQRSKEHLSSISRSRSRSFSSKSSTKEEPSGTKQSCSDMSISPPSGSSLSMNSESSDSDFDSRLHDPVSKKGRVITTSKNRRSSHSHITSRVSDTSKSILEKRPFALDTKVATKPVNCKKMCGLEMELLKYQGALKSVPKQPAVKPFSIKTKSFQSSVKKGAGLEGIIAKPNQINPNKPSKRDLLMKQLQAVEEAIARKKKHSSM